MIDRASDRPTGRVDKFDWFMAVQADTRLSAADKYVLQNMAVTYVNHRRREGVLYVRQSVMAERFKVGLRTVERAISKAKQLGYLVVDVPRKRGPGHHGPDKYRLAIPELPANLAGHSPVNVTMVDNEQLSDATITRQIGGSYPELPAKLAVITRQIGGNDPPGENSLPAKTPTPTGERTGEYTGERTTTGDRAFSAENAPNDEMNTRLADHGFEQENAPLRSASLDEKQELALDAEVLCRTCSEEPAHPFSSDGLCPRCHADAEADRKFASSVEEMLG
ncbi:hypothetical protein [Mycolicibacterium mageritense]|uniref:Helix-turn-helix domain-containing protein n=1 Tax=Mycolicibacterium mageritense TaxID=53462 RepID=A0ABM7HTN8_MYCME|nr:hypothetical protein [Mycolicibacterium mageritense]MCC9186734.1 helix-turn-helix domain-containing protein [Mycolicibacterium mageritense]BBX33938.1 hypothetical protein MMAGJ_32200 [Mycolicibacterium mageritense]CDO22357.1 hypothetical protein BN978_02830 [Mycolicibacterium mageritense DSM 44476 = CIP 104973]